MPSPTPPYEWIFSGAGVAASVRLPFAWLYRRFRGRTSSPAPGTDSSHVNILNSNVGGPVAGRDVNIGTYIKNEEASERPGEFSETPTPNDIESAIEAASLYMQESVAQSFVGIKVRWKGTLSEIDFVTHLYPYFVLQIIARPVVRHLYPYFRCSDRRPHHTCHC
jgi:hypothetical protein